MSEVDSVAASVPQRRAMRLHPTGEMFDIIGSTKRIRCGFRDGVP
jgi:hypothetical protein